ncbi:MAG TPA: tetratricopeptide repeat protein [Ramlibacter sp.]
MTTISRFLALLAALALALFALGASAQDAPSAAGEPTVAQIYQAANGGHLDRADAMIDQVLKAHPSSAKAHYVKAEVAARQGKADVARQQLAAAEKIAPGLPFAKAESVQALRNELANAGNTAVTAPSHAQRLGAPANTYNNGYAGAQRSFPWGTLAIVAAIVLIGAAVLRRRTSAMAAGSYGAGYGGAYGNTSAAPYGQTGYGPVYPPGAGGAYPQQPSMGSTLARGVGTGLAMGAGMVAAEEIGRRMFDHGDPRAAAYDPNANMNTPSLDQIDDGMRRNLNSDMGGADFGVNDGGGWDDGGGGGDFSSGDLGGGGDWGS